MKTSLTASRMKACDEYTIHTLGISSPVLMERAALALSDEVLAYLTEMRKDGRIAKNKSGYVLVFCGSGNNGGDGYACARILRRAGVDARTVAVGNTARRTEETKHQADLAARLAVPEMSEADPAEADLLVDAIFGIGLSRDVTGVYAELIEKINASGRPVIACDIPSGLDADTGCVHGIAVRADVTVTMQCLKRGLVLREGRAYAGRIVCAEIGVVDPSELSAGSALDARKDGDCYPASDALNLCGEDGDALNFCLRDARAVYPEDICTYIPVRSVTGNKATFGKVLLVVGSRGMAGAALMAAEAALRSGCGMVRIVTHEDNRVIAQTALPEAMLSTYTDAASALASVRAGFAWADVVVAGCGLGQSDTASALVEMLLKECPLPLVLDADGLNLAAKMPDLLCAHTMPLYMTPHPGEAARLAACTAGDILKDIVTSACELAKKTSAVCILKDASTVTADMEGGVYINTTGNEGMATAGSGDVLAGLLGGLVAQGLSGSEAAFTAVCLHGLAGNMAKKKLGSAFMTARDIIGCLGEALLSAGQEREA